MVECRELERGCGEFREGQRVTATGTLRLLKAQGRYAALRFLFLTAARRMLC